MYYQLGNCQETWFGPKVELIKTKEGGLIVGDGRVVSPMGIIKNLSLKLAENCEMKVDALCIDVANYSYEFIMGRNAMAAMGVGVDLGSSYWYVRQGQEFHPLSVSYVDTKNSFTDSPKPEDCFLFTVYKDGDISEKQPTEIDLSAIKDAPTDGNNGKLDKLLKQIENNSMLTQEQKDRAIQLVKDKQAAFGASYKA